MAYLSLEEFGRPQQDIEMLLQKFPFFDFAATYWHSHIETTADFRCHLPFQVFLKEIGPPDNHKAQIWIRQHNSYRISFASYPSRISEVAIRCDIGWLAELLLNREQCGILDDFRRDYLSRAVDQSREGVVMEVLLKHERIMELKITDTMVQAITEYHRCAIMALLLDRRGAEIQITGKVVTTVAGNSRNGKKIMVLFFNRRGTDVQITKKPITAAAGNSRDGREIMDNFFDLRGTDVQITKEMVTAAIGNWFNGKEVMAFFLDRRGTDILKQLQGTCVTRK